MHPEPWHLLGVGSVGGLFAARLHAAGIPLTLLLRDEAALAAWQTAGGLAVGYPDGHWQHLQPPATLAATLPTAPRHLLVTTKAPDTLAALVPLLRGDGDGQLVLLLQNGMGVADALRARWPRLRLWQAVTTAGAWRESAFRLHCVAEGATHAGRIDDAGDPALDTAVNALCEAGLMAASDDIRAMLWRKLAINAVINALTAIHACRNGELEEIPAAAAQLPLLAAEVEAVAAAEGVRFEQPVLAIAREVIRLTAANHSSMNRDAAAGRRTEIDFINGHVVAVARRHGIAVPANLAAWQAVQALPRRDAWTRDA